MRIFALDTSGSAMLYFGQMCDHIGKISDSPKDMFVGFDSSGVSRPVLVSDIGNTRITSHGGDGIERLVEWMEDRSLQPTDELIIYHDLQFPGENLRRLKDGWFTVKFKAFAGCSPAVVRAIRQAGMEVEVLPF